MLARQARALHPAGRASFTSTSLCFAQQAKAPVVTESEIILPWNNGPSSKFHHIWLRDHCHCAQCFHPVTKQRLLDTFSIPPHLKPVETQSKHDGLHVQCNLLLNESNIGHDMHQSVYPWDWLLKHSYNPSLAQNPESDLKKELWSSKDMQSAPSVSFHDIMKSRHGLAEWTRLIVCPLSPCC